MKLNTKIVERLAFELEVVKAEACRSLFGTGDVETAERSLIMELCHTEKIAAPASFMARDQCPSQAES
jgi:hypothetical protein